MQYSRIFGSNFPSQLIPIGTKKDIDDSIKDLATQYYELINNGNIDEANELYNSNHDTLEKYMINMEYINRIEEEIYNIALGVLKGSSTIIGNQEPVEQMQDGYWYQDY